MRKCSDIVQLLYIRNSGWKPIEVPVTWNHHTLSQNAKEFISFYNQHKGDKNQILGFSYGAVISLLTANEICPDKMYLCSLSPDFAEDKDTMPAWLKKYIGKNRLDDMTTRSAVTLAKNLKVPTVIFYGEKEAVDFPSMKKRAEETTKFAKNARLIVVPNANHAIDGEEYKESLLANLEL